MGDQRKKLRVLVVEDDPLQAMKVEALLQLEGCDVRVAPNGRDALALLEEAPADIVVSDIMMPELDGYEMCKRIRSDERFEGVGVILLTCLTEPQDVMRGLEAGADNFLPKPYESTRLIQMVKDMADGQVVLEKGRARVRFQGKSYTVNSSRLQMLNFFLTLYEDILRKNEEIARTQKELQYVNENLARLVSERTADLSAEVESRKKAEETSRERAQLLDKAGDAIFVMDLEGIIRYANKSNKKLYGWSEPEMAGRTLSRLLFDAKRPFPALCMAAVQEKGEWIGTLHQVAKNGEAVTVMSSWTLVRDDQQRPRSILCINTRLADNE